MPGLLVGLQTEVHHPERRLHSASDGAARHELSAFALRRRPGRFQPAGAAVHGLVRILVRSAAAAEAASVQAAILQLLHPAEALRRGR